MRHKLYKIFLKFLRTLVLTKRAFFRIFKILKPFFEKIGQLYRSTLGFWVYKILFGVKRRTGKFNNPIKGSIAHFFGKRNTLQVVFFVVAIVVMIPHSSLYTQDSASVPGRNSVLYKMVGSGEQDFDMQEVIIDISAIQTPQDTRSWREASIVLETGATPQKVIIEKEGISGITAGGSAIAKPSIITGAEIPTIEAGRVDSRTEILNYEVQPGDVIGSIAQKFGLNTITVLWANGLTSRSYIRPGDKLKILPTDGVLHKVVSGDNISKIASKYSVKVDEIVEYNKLANASDIIVGEQLIVPGGVKPRAVYIPRPSSGNSVFRNVSAPPPSVSSPAGSEFVWPAGVRRITQYYGWRHTALDIAGPIGTPLYASKSGTVIKSKCGWNGGYGCYVILNHGGGVQTLYAHSSQLLVSYGEKVVQGQVIALMGSTGRSTGSHIHYEVRINGVRKNPLRYIK
ncbi:MAG: LysM peptidoglycan-binding domain-containing M23 family metallopeptidase [Candidatus Magasanikbacteria bacterium]|nr:LysM peptidoglycan-binding domain-containing M23 family metallopeptidase [Candidatus Magasanikbacteria bacterium]